MWFRLLRFVVSTIMLTFVPRFCFLWYDIQALLVKLLTGKYSWSSESLDTEVGVIQRGWKLSKFFRSDKIMGS